jgi:hypothetical protein
MSLSRIALTALGTTVIYFVLGFLMFPLLPAMTREFRKYPDVYRSQEGMKKVMPVGIAATFVAILVLVVIYALAFEGGYGVMAGLRFGALIGVFVVCGFVLHNYVNLNIGLKLALQQAGVYFVQWTIIGMMISLIYRPAIAR